jgi:molybdopterin-containing oxidoreductase family membrane subunit
MLSDEVRKSSLEQTGHHGGSWLSPAEVMNKISGLVLSLRTPGWWWVGLMVSGVLALGLFFLIVRLLQVGVGLWALNTPIIWGVDITNFIFWIGIGHAGTLISAVLYLFRQQWRTSLSRLSETMTIFALAVAGLWPIFHTGRPWLALWLTPYPNTLGLNPQWRSPLVWDVFAISTYLLVSLLFWFMGLVPDIAALRDRAKHPFAKLMYGLLSLGWRGEATHWQRYHTATFLLAALSTPLVISVHSIVGLDFAVGLVGGWHQSVFPPYFVAGAVFSGLAMVLLIALPLRAAFKLHDYIKMDYLESAAKVMLVTGLLVGYGYLMEAFAPYYAGHKDEVALFNDRASGFYAPAFWTMVTFNVVISQLLWFKAVRRSPFFLSVISIFVLIGMWLERFVIIVTSLYAQRLSSMWNPQIFGPWDYATALLPFGLFFTLLLLFIRFLPMLPIFETQEMVAEGHD